MVAAASSSDRMPVEDHGCMGWIAMPASGGTALTTAVRGIVITADGNLQLKLANGTTNTDVIAVTAGPTVWPYAAIQLGASNTAGVIGVY